jgi:hypothetical protein
MSYNSQLWKTKEITHEGFPLLLRYREGIDVSSYKAAFPKLAVITHEFSQVRQNGLPDPDYNDSLFQFDSDIRSAFEERNCGCAILIETFGGKRRYYIYVLSTIDIAETLSSIRRGNPNEQLTWIVRPDPEWDFIHKYSQQFLNG